MKKQIKRQRIQQPEFTFDSLPLTRRAQFFDIFKIEWRNLIKLGLLTLLFLTPFLISYFLMLFFASNLEEGNPILIIIFGYFALFISLFVETINISGMANVLKKMIYGEGILFKDDYLEGIKRNYLQVAFVTAIYGLLYLIIDFSCKYIFGFDGMLPLIFSGICKAFLFFLLTPIAFITTCECITYDIKFISAIRNSLVLFISKFWQFLVIGLMLQAMDLVYLISNVMIFLPVVAVIVIIVVPLLTLAILLLATSSFDIFINKESFPELYRKGLKKEGN